MGAAKIPSECLWCERWPVWGYVDGESAQSSFYPTALKGCLGIVFAHGVRAGGWQEKVFPGSISETVRCRKLILGRDI